MLKVRRAHLMGKDIVCTLLKDRGCFMQQATGSAVNFFVYGGIILMPAKLTQEEFVRKAHEINPNLEILSKYKGRTKRVLRRCLVCGDVREQIAASILIGDGCKACAMERLKKSRLKSHEQFIAELAEINPNIEVLTNYVNANIKILCKCKLDGFEWNVVPNSLLSGTGCPECYRKRAGLRTTEEFVEELSKKYPKIKVLGDYIGVDNKIRVKCKECGEEWVTTPTTLLNRNTKNDTKCPKCCVRNYIREDEFLKRLKENNPKVSYASGYHGIVYNARFKCNMCGYEWEANAGNVLRGTACPKCCVSRGASRIRYYLESKNIEYDMEYRFKDCKDINCLPFDFYLKDYNTCIEFQGGQHYFSVEHFGGEEKLLYTQRHDAMKKEYCESHNIKLITIPYTSYNEIEEILDKEIA